MNDLVSRQDAVEAIYKHIDTFDAIDTNYLDGLRTAMSFLKEMPSAQVDLSGYSDRLWKSAYDRGYARCKQDAIEELRGVIVKDVQFGDELTDGYNDGIDMAITLISKLPSAQSEIIRCKDCKYWTHIKRTNRYWCKTDDGLYDLNPSPNDFCSRAERKENG